MSELYLGDETRNFYKEELKQIYDFYVERIKPIVKDPEEEAKVYVDKLRQERCSSLYADGEVNISEIDDGLIEAGTDKYRVISLMKYRNLVLWTFCLYQSWEQQLMKFLKIEYRFNGERIEDFNNFWVIENSFIKHNINIKSLESWGKIDELKKLVNVIKHTKGNSYIDLKEIRPDYFEFNKEYKVFMHKENTLDYYESTLLDETIMMKEKDFSEYYEALLSFWDQLPTDMISD